MAGEPIPVTGFGVLAAVFSLVGHPLVAAAIVIPAVARRLAD